MSSISGISSSERTGGCWNSCLTIVSASSALARQIAISQFQQYGIYQIQDEHLEAYVKRILESEEDRERMVRRLFEDKVFAAIREKATIVEKEVSSDEFGAMMRNTPEEEA